MESFQALHRLVRFIFEALYNSAIVTANNSQSTSIDERVFCNELPRCKQRGINCLQTF